MPEFLHRCDFWALFASCWVVALFRGFGGVSLGGFFEHPFGRVTLVLATGAMLVLLGVAGLQHGVGAAGLVAVIAGVSWIIARRAFIVLWSRSQGLTVFNPRTIRMREFHNWAKVLGPRSQRMDANQVWERLLRSRPSRAELLQESLEGAFLDAIWNDPALREHLVRMGRDRAWLKEALNWFARLNWALAGGVTLCQPQFLDAFLRDCAHGEMRHFDVVGTAIVRTGYVDLFYRRR